jgi:hypothetical protein
MRIAILLFVILCFSCRKKTEPFIELKVFAPEEIPVEYPEYMPLKVGNYWIYERFKMELNGISESTGQIDSCYVIKDTLIRNERYWKLKKFDFVFNRVEFWFQRDSLHYIINQAGIILFSSGDFSSIFLSRYHVGPDSDTVSYIFDKMNDKDLPVTTAAGTFTTSNMQTSVTLFPKYLSPNVPNPRYLNKRFAKDVGIITETEPFYVAFNFMHGRRLIRYYLN